MTERRGYQNIEKFTITKNSTAQRYILSKISKPMLQRVNLIFKRYVIYYVYMQQKLLWILINIIDGWMYNSLI